jgi:hypothetical protein
MQPRVRMLLTVPAWGRGGTHLGWAWSNTGFRLMCVRVLLAAGVAALSSVLYAAPAAAQPATGWWYAGRSGEAPQRQLVFIDRASGRAQRGEASARAMSVFEQPRGDVKAFAITYAFRCAARQFQTSDAVFTTTANTQEPETGIVDDWGAVVPGSVAAILLDAACFGRFGREAQRIAAAPLSEAGAIFARLTATVQAPPTRRPNAPPTRTAQECFADTDRQRGDACFEEVMAAESARQDADRARLATMGARGPFQCSGSVHSEGQLSGRFSVSLSFSDGQGVIRLLPDPYRLSGRYNARLSGDTVELALPNNIVARFYVAVSQFNMRLTHSWDEEDLDPNNPYGTYRVSERVQYLAQCS